MAYSSVFLQRANKLGIEVSEPVNALLVCKLMLENLSWTLSADLRKAVRNIDGLESELREVRMALKEMQHPQIALSLMNNKHISSIDSILSCVKEAYSHVFAASETRDEGGAHFDVSQSLLSCHDAIDRALQEFPIS